MYYNLRLDWDPKVIGVNNGVYQVELDKGAYDKSTYSILESLFVHNTFSPESIIPEVDFEFCFKRLKTSKNTSFMSFAPNLNHCHFLISEVMMKLFKAYNIQKYTGYNSKIYDYSGKNADHSYKLFFMVLQDWCVIDFDNCIFTSGGFGKMPVIDLKFKDENELKNFAGISNVKKLSLNENFDNSLDLFLTRVGGVFVSEKLKLALEANHASGLKFYNDVEVSFYR